MYFNDYLQFKFPEVINFNFLGLSYNGVISWKFMGLSFEIFMRLSVRVSRGYKMKFLGGIFCLLVGNLLELSQTDYYGVIIIMVININFSVTS